MTYHGPVVPTDAKGVVLAISDNAAFTRAIEDRLGPDAVQSYSTDLLLSGAIDVAPGKKGARKVLLLEAAPDRTDILGIIAKARALCGDQASVLAVVPSASSFEHARSVTAAGAEAVLPDTVSGDELLDQVTRLSAPRRPAALSAAAPGRNGQVIAVTQARGGIGATSVAVNLACGLVGGKRALRKKAGRKRVALLDLDLQFGNAHVYFDLEDNGGMQEIADSAAVPDAHMLTSVLQSHESGVDVLSAPTKFLPMNALQGETVDALLSQLQEQYDYVVVDLPRAMVEWIEPVLTRAAQMVLVTDTTVPCIRQAQRVVNFYHEDHVGLPVQVVVNREKRPMFKTEHLREAEKILDRPFATWLPDSPAVARRAVDLGKPVIQTQPRSDLGKAFRKLVTSVAAATAAQEAARS